MAVVNSAKERHTLRAKDQRQGVGRYRPDSVVLRHDHSMLPPCVNGESSSAPPLIDALACPPYATVMTPPVASTDVTYLPAMLVLKGRPADWLFGGMRPRWDTKSHTAARAPVARLMPSETCAR